MARLRIGELSRRTDTPPELLRAWESRYGLLRPERTPGGFRLYGEQDVRRVEAMHRLLADGLSAAQAARQVVEEADADRETPPARAQLAALTAALDRLDDQAAHAAFDRALAELSVDGVLDSLVLPYLADLGRRWERGEASIVQEHFASALLRGRLLGLARGWGNGGSPSALLACGPDEQHDLALICLGLALRARGWQITFLGARTPTDALLAAVEDARPDVCVLAVTVPIEADEALARVAALTRLVVAGAGADEALAERLDAELMRDDPVRAAATLAA